MRAAVKRRLLRDERGFTLVEVLITMTIMLVVLSALYGIFDMSLRVFSQGNNEVEATENARLGLEKMEREIRAAYPYDKGPLPPATTPDAHLFDPGAWTATRIRFGNDLDGNRKVECPNPAGGCEVISYQLYDTGGGKYALGRANSPAGTLQPVVEHVDYDDMGTPDPNDDTGLRFTYFQRNGTTEVPPGGTESNIGMVRVELGIRVNPGAQEPPRISPGTQTLTTDVALRNRGG